MAEHPHPLSDAELQFLQQLRHHPQLYERLRALVDLADSGGHTPASADEVEAQLLELTRQLGRTTLESWAALAEHPLVGEARMTGLMGAFEIVKKKEPMQRFDSKQGAGTVFRDAAIRNGICLRASGDTIICAPPFTLTHAEADELIDKARRALDESLALLHR